MVARAYHVSCVYVYGTRGKTGNEGRRKGAKVPVKVVGKARGYGHEGKDKCKRVKLGRDETYSKLENLSTDSQANVRPELCISHCERSFI